MNEFIHAISRSKWNMSYSCKIKHYYNVFICLLIELNGEKKMHIHCLGFVVVYCIKNKALTSF